MPDTEIYLERIRQLAEGSSPLETQQETHRVIAELVAGVSAERLRRRPQPNKWSAVEIIAHLAEDELVTSWRYRQMLEAPGCALAGFDQDKWAAWGAYQDWTVEEALSMFTLMRNANLRLLRRLTEDQWQCFGVHAERGRITVRDLAAHMAGHDRNHLQQIQSLLAA